MLTRQMIKKYAGNVSYGRGLDIYESGQVLSMEVEEDDGGFYEIHARVKGSGRKSYLVDMGYDPYEEELISVSCECPAFYSYSGICKHCVAVLIAFEASEYNNYYFGEPEENPFYRQLSLFEETTPKRRKTKQTTSSVKRLLQQQMSRKGLMLSVGNAREQIKLDPYLTCTKDNISLEFRIGNTRMYVIKDIYEFCENMKSEHKHYYGKELDFRHTMSAFDIESRKLVKFILNWAKQNEERYSEYHYYYNYGYNYSTGYSKIRVMALDDLELEDFLEAVGERTFIANMNGTGDRKYRNTDEKLKFVLQIQGEDQGIKITAANPSCYHGRRYDIYFKDGLVYREERNKPELVSEFIACVEETGTREVFVGNEDICDFCRELLPALKQVYQCREKNFDSAKYEAPKAEYEIYLDAPQRNFITCSIQAVYGNEKYEIYKVPDDRGVFSDHQQINRNISEEMKTGQAVGAWFNAFDSEKGQMVLADDEEGIYRLLTEGIPALQELGTVYISDALRRMKVVSAPKVELGISLSGELLELNLVSDDMSMEQLAEILSRYERKRKYYRLKDGSFVNIDEEKMGSLFELKETMGLSESQLKKGKTEVPKYRALYLDSEMEETAGVILKKNEEFKQLILNMKGTEEQKYEIPASLEETLRDYQKKGFQWLKCIAANGFGGVLADDMGLGKTLQIIAFLLSEFLEAGACDNRRCLIVTPASLVFNWHNEFQRFAPVLPVKMIIGTASERKEIVWESGERDILITSYDLLKRDLDNYSGINFYCQVLDEAQFIKNHNTQAARAVKQISAGHRFALTGTPIENRLSELWSIFDYLMPGFLYSYQRFRGELELPIVQNGDEKTTKQLQKMIKPFVLRRLKTDVLKDLPEKLEENVFAKMSGEQQKLYDAHVKRMKLFLDKQTDEEFKNSKIQILAELTKLRQLCCDPALIYRDFYEDSAKLTMCMDLIQNAIEGGHKILLFSQFTSMLETIQKKLAEQSVSFYALTGATPKEKRIELVEKFNQDETNVFCISLKAGGTGLNLTSADIVIHFDPWWNLAVQNQATDRAHRIGQQNVVTVYKLIAKGTIEENIIKLQEKKKELADKLLSGEDMGTGSFTREELLSILG